MGRGFEIGVVRVDDGRNSGLGTNSGLDTTHIRSTYVIRSEKLDSLI